MAAAELQECPSPTAPHGSCTERRVRRGCSPLRYIVCINFYNLQENRKKQKTAFRRPPPPPDQGFNSPEHLLIYNIIYKI